MAEPQPSTIHEGSSTPSSLPAPNKPEAQALNSLDGPPSSANETSKPSNGDAKALNHAMKNLDVGGKKAEVKNVKVEVGDIGLLADHLDISRSKATELLKANEADPVKAMRAWIST